MTVHLEIPAGPKDLMVMSAECKQMVFVVVWRSDQIWNSKSKDSDKRTKSQWWGQTTS